MGWTRQLIFTLASLALTSLGISRPASANSGHWELVHVDPAEREMVAVVLPSANDQTVWAASRHALYESIDAGVSWQPRFRVPDQTHVTGIAPDPFTTTVLLATDHGTFRSPDGGQHWASVFRGANPEEAHCSRVAFHPQQQGTALLGTQHGLFISTDHGERWSPVAGLAQPIIHFDFDTQHASRLYLVSTQGLFVGDLSTGLWHQQLHTMRTDQDDGADDVPDVEDVAEQDASLRRLTAVASDPQQPSTLYLATSRGLERSQDGGLTWRTLSQVDVASSAISRLILRIRSPTTVYLATAHGVVSFDPHHERWTSLPEGLTTTQIYDLAVSHHTLWAATADGLFRYELPPDIFTDTSPPKPQDLLSDFASEPPITQIREAAVRYADVSPKKIAAWRTQARLKALVPKISITGDTNLTDFRHWDSGTNPDTLLTGKRDLDWTTNVLWELGDLIWSDDQTSIDVRSKLMVELRDDIVHEVTRLYFERRRLQALLVLEPPNEPKAILEKELRIQELTALLDGLTGGFFSDHLQRKPQEELHGDARH